jgi:hypothetical protein
VFAVTSPLFIHPFTILIMQTPNGMKSFYDFVNLHGRKQLVASLRAAHDHLLYDCCLTIDSEKKEVLHDLKLLADQLKQLPRKSTAFED